MLDRSSPEFVPLLGDAIVALSHMMCGVPPDRAIPPGGKVEGFDKLAPEYMRTTEHRDGPGPEERRKYSSCGDQLHAILRRIGVREPWVNQGANHVFGTLQIAKLEPVGMID